MHSDATTHVNAATLEATPTAKPFSPLVAETNAHEQVVLCGDRRWRIRGLARNMSYEQLKINVLVSRVTGPQHMVVPGLFHVDSLDLYHARQRQAFIKQAALELHVSEGVIQTDLGHLLLYLEQLQDQQIKAVLEPKPKTVELTEAEREAALALLNDPQLLERILTDFNRCGIVGEETNKLMGYLAAVSRKLEEPLAIVIQSSSAAGKTSLMEAVLSFFPGEERVKYSAMTGQSLFYMGETNLKHKILAIVEEEGAEKASYALKLLQSEGELTIASTGKDPATGKLITHEYHVEGPVMIFLTTTAIEIDEELQNRCMVLSVDEDREQTRAIHRMQRKLQTLEGLLQRQDRQAILKVHQDAQRLLHPLLVANPYAEQLTFLDDRTRMRRDHMKYLTLIRTIALLHQYQRPRKHIKHGDTVVDYIEVTLEDIDVANRLAHQVLGCSLDELAPQTRRLLLMLDEHISTQCAALAMKRSDYRFTQKEAREATGFGNTQLKVHLRQLEELDYVLVHRSVHGQRFDYELVYAGEGQDGEKFITGLVDPNTLRLSRYDGKRSGANGSRSERNRAQVGVKSVLSRGILSIKKADKHRAKYILWPKWEKNTYIGPRIKTPHHLALVDHTPIAPALSEMNPS